MPLNSTLTPSETPPAQSSLPASRDRARLQAIQEQILIAGDLPTLPTIAMEVSRLASSPLTGMSEIVRIIRNDPPLTAKVLRVANSAFYGMSRRIESLNMALVVLGMREINHLVTCIAVLRVFPPREGEAVFDRKSFWDHSAACGELARVLASRLRLRLHGIEFTAGLLHDVGKILLDQYVHRDFIAALSLAARDKLPSWEAEQRVVGVDHAELGAWLAERWSLPASIVEVIRFHHHVTAAPENRSLTAVVHLANVLAKALLDRGSHARLAEQLLRDPAWDSLAQQSPEILQLDISQFTAELEENMEHAQEFIRIASE